MSSFTWEPCWRCSSTTGANGSTWWLSLANGNRVQRRLLFLLIVASVPGAIIGVMLEKQAESTFRSPLLIAGTMAILGILLWAADAYGSKKRKIGDITLPRCRSDRPESGVCDCPRRLTFRRHDYDGPHARHRTRRCGKFLIPDGDADYRRRRVCSRCINFSTQASRLSLDGASQPRRSSD